MYRILLRRFYQDNQEHRRKPIRFLRNDRRCSEKCHTLTIADDIRQRQHNFSIKSRNERKGVILKCIRNLVCD